MTGQKVRDSCGISPGRTFLCSGRSVQGEARTAHGAGGHHEHRAPRRGRVGRPRRRRRNPASTGRAATIRAPRCRTAIRRSARRVASARPAAGPGALFIRRPRAARRCAGSSAMWCRASSRAAACRACAAPALSSRKIGAIEYSIDRYGGDYRSFETTADPKGKPCADACQAENRCRAWTYRRAGLRRDGPALLSQGHDQAAAAPAVLYFGSRSVRARATLR